MLPLRIASIAVHRQFRIAHKRAEELWVAREIAAGRATVLPASVCLENISQKVPVVVAGGGDDVAGGGDGTNDQLLLSFDPLGIVKRGDAMTVMAGYVAVDDRTLVKKGAGTKRGAVASSST